MLGLSCSAACEIFLAQGLNLCLLHWQEDSLPLSHHGNPTEVILMKGNTLSNCQDAECDFFSCPSPPLSGREKKNLSRKYFFTTQSPVHQIQTWIMWPFLKAGSLESEFLCFSAFTKARGKWLGGSGMAIGQQQ